MFSLLFGGGGGLWEERRVGTWVLVPQSRSKVNLVFVRRGEFPNFLCPNNIRWQTSKNCLLLQTPNANCTTCTTHYTSITNWNAQQMWDMWGWRGGDRMGTGCWWSKTIHLAGTRNISQRQFDFLISFVQQMHMCANCYYTCSRHFISEQTKTKKSKNHHVHTQLPDMIFVKIFTPAHFYNFENLPQKTRKSRHFGP